MRLTKTEMEIHKPCDPREVMQRMQKMVNLLGAADKDIYLTMGRGSVVIDRLLRGDTVEEIRTTPYVHRYYETGDDGEAMTRVDALTDAIELVEVAYAAWVKARENGPAYVQHTNLSYAINAAGMEARK